MSAWILGTGLSRGKGGESLRARPEFRRATRGMILATLAVREALGEVEPDEALALVLGSGYGELEVTRDFLVTFAESGLARPLLFQSSLHNATTGFLALSLGIRGPTTTISNRFLTGESCLDTATLLLQSGVADACLAVAFEARVPSLQEGLEAVYAPERKLGEGAAALLLANDAGRARLGRPALGVLDGVDFSVGPCASSRSSEYYDSDALERLVDALRAVDESGPHELVLEKPSGACSMIRWRTPT